MSNDDGYGWIIFLVILVLIIVWWKPRFLQPKYEGRTAEEWYDQANYFDDKYSELKECVENYDTFEPDERATTLVSEECAY